MDQETISRKEKIEMARRQSWQADFPYKKTYHTYQKENLQEQESEHSYFFLRILLSCFLLLAILGITRFEAMGEQESQKYQAKLVKVLKKQPEIDYIKGILKSIK